MIHTCKFCSFHSTRKYNLKIHYGNKNSCSRRTAQDTLDLIEELMHPIKSTIKIKELQNAIRLADYEIEKLQKKIKERNIVMT